RRLPHGAHARSLRGFGQADGRGRPGTIVKRVRADGWRREATLRDNREMLSLVPQKKCFTKTFLFESEETEMADVPPGPVRVARRALIQSAVVCRGNIESEPDRPDVVETHSRIQDWLQELDLIPAMEPLEKKLIDAPLGTLGRSI